MSLSERTEAIISERAALYSHGELTALLKHANIGKNDPGPTKPNGSWNNKPTRVSAALGKNPGKAELIALGAKILNDTADGTDEPEWVADLRSSLLVDGYSLSHDSGKWSIDPVGAEEIPLAPQVSDLEKALVGHGLTIAANHYRQAFSAFKRQDWEACNSSTRATVESFFVEVAKSQAAFSPSPNQGGGGPALAKLNEEGKFEPGEHDYVKGFWKMSHTNGSHPGLSNEQEALFRFSAATSALTFFIHRWLS
jgi:hypothetical protein